MFIGDLFPVYFQRFQTIRIEKQDNERKNRKEKSVKMSREMNVQKPIL